jgi:hypothetical protein
MSHLHVDPFDTTMSEVQIMTLLGPPVKSVSEGIAKEAINSHFRSIDDLGNLDVLVEEAQTKFAEFSKAVRGSAQSYSIMSQPNLVA